MTITSADFVLDEYDAGHFQEKMSYVGQVLKPEELEIQASQFQRAVAGGEGYINFQQSKFLGSRLLEEGNYELISGSMIQYQTYSLILETNGQKQDSETLQPQFVITPWKKQYRLLGLKFAN
ncbi:hypothetical protein [Synechococcus sp. PCC 6312]|uniref:hypothetical protein n=1 Tax=Synechococcus sp. (strain ATCC 27167 / PCC 6312) TaxID=195253 RepID=UPI0012EA61F8|nr:hypothetical protein [Synechococcus sp. PCC 6312]